MPRGDRLLEHVLRRIGFGASARGPDRYAGRPSLAVIDALLNYEQAPDNVDDNIGKPEYVARHDARAVLAEHRHQRRAPARAVPHGPQPAPAAGEDGAVLAQPLRHRVQQDQRHVRIGARHQDDGGPSGSGAGQSARAVSAVSATWRRATSRDLLFEVAKDPAMLVWLDGRNNTRQRPQENFGREIMELFTHGRRQLRRGRRLRGGARLHRLGAAAGRRSRERRRRRITSSSTTPNQHDADGEGVHVRDLSGWRQDDSGARRRLRACRMGST